MTISDEEAQNGSDLEFEPDTTEPPIAGDLAKLEAEQFGKNPRDNTVVIKLWGGGYITFNPQDSVSIFALLALVLLLGVLIFVAIIGIGTGDTAWMGTISTALGHAITGVVGAIVGSAASKKK